MIHRAENNQLFIMHSRQQKDILKILNKISKPKEITRPSSVSEKEILEKSRSTIMEQYYTNNKVSLIGNLFDSIILKEKF